MKQYALFEGNFDDLSKPIVKTIKDEIAELKKSLKTKTDEEYLTTAEVAELLKVNVSTIFNWRQRGKIIAYQISGKVLFKKREIEKAIVQLKTKRR